DVGRCAQALADALGDDPRGGQPALVDVVQRDGAGCELREAEHVAYERLGEDRAAGADEGDLGHVEAPSLLGLASLDQARRRSSVAAPVQVGYQPGRRLSATPGFNATPPRWGSTRPTDRSPAPRAGSRSRFRPPTACRRTELAASTSRTARPGEPAPPRNASRALTRCVTPRAADPVCRRTSAR